MQITVGSAQQPRKLEHVWQWTCATRVARGERNAAFPRFARFTLNRTQFLRGFSGCQSHAVIWSSPKCFADAHYDNWLLSSWLEFPTIWHSLCLRFTEGWVAGVISRLRHRRAKGGPADLFELTIKLAAFYRCFGDTYRSMYPGYPD